MDSSGWPRMLGVEVDNLRAALNWAFSTEGDPNVGIELAAASASTWMGMGLLTECRAWMTKAINRLDSTTAGTRSEMIIQSALASCLMFTDGMTEESYDTWAKARLLARGVNDIESELTSLFVLWAHQIRMPNYTEAIKLADHCGEVAEAIRERGAIATANYMRGVRTTTRDEFRRPKRISNCHYTATMKCRDYQFSSGLAGIVKCML
jgi:hypothetical protein